MRSLTIVAALLLAGCGSGSDSVYTLYRNSPIEAGARIHWATFDTADKGTIANTKPYNLENCSLAADVLNANVRRLNDGKQIGKFWCEPGRYHEKK